MGELGWGCVLGFMIAHCGDALWGKYIAPLLNASWARGTSMAKRPPCPDLKEVLETLQDEDNHYVVKVLLPEDLDDRTTPTEALYVYMIAGNELSGAGFLLNDPGGNPKLKHGDLVGWEIVDEKMKPYITESLR